MHVLPGGKRGFLPELYTRMRELFRLLLPGTSLGLWFSRRFPGAGVARSAVHSESIVARRVGQRKSPGETDGGLAAGLVLLGRPVLSPAYLPLFTVWMLSGVFVSVQLL